MTWGTSQSFPLSPCPVQTLSRQEARQAEEAQAGAWPSVGREGSCAVFGVEVAIMPLLAANSITALYCFSWLLKISFS